ncbi:MAG: hypothetical protein NZ700_06225 [Gemmataceae bacterium]|nr:hypothetical protein [Gemmataceae bacterium]MDW8263778.1 hypothetical protein [Gemmataceae bacterium]
MFRKLVCALFGFMVCVGIVVAAEIKGKVKSVDAEKNTITVTTKDGDKTFPIAADAKITVGKGSNLKDLKEGAGVMLRTEVKDGKEVVVELKAGGKKKDDK